jgi:adenylate kinase
MKIILLGAPGSGKGTQSQFLIKEWGATQLSTGDLLRRAIEEGTELGIQAKEFMDNGQLVPDDLVISLIKSKLDDLGNGTNVIFDGFPRSHPQAEALDQVLGEMGSPIEHVVYIKVPQDELVKRLSGRRSCGECGAAFHIHFNQPEKEGVCDNCGSDLIHRKDDTPEVIQKRFETYERETSPLVDYYQGKSLLTEFDGTGEPSDLSKRIFGLLNS